MNETQPGKLFVGGLSTETTKITLKTYFEKFGEVLECIIMQDKHTNRTRGFGFVTYKDASVAHHVFSITNHIVDGKNVECKLAVPKDQPPANHAVAPHIDANTNVNNVVTFENSLNNINVLGNVKSLTISNSTNVAHDENVDHNLNLQYNSKKIFVGGLPSTVTESDMIDYFKKFGEILDCMVMFDKVSGKPRGFGFVIFKDEASIEQILKNKTKHIINGKWLDCKRATPKDLLMDSQSSSTLRENLTPGVALRMQTHPMQTKPSMQSMPSMPSMQSMPSMRVNPNNVNGFYQNYQNNQPQFNQQVIQGQNIPRNSQYPYSHNEQQYLHNQYGNMQNQQHGQQTPQGIYNPFNGGFDNFNQNCRFNQFNQYNQYNQYNQHNPQMNRPTIDSNNYSPNANHFMNGNNLKYNNPYVQMDAYEMPDCNRPNDRNNVNKYPYDPFNPKMYKSSGLNGSTPTGSLDGSTQDNSGNLGSSSRFNQSVSNSGSKPVKRSQQTLFNNNFNLTMWNKTSSSSSIEDPSKIEFKNTSPTSSDYFPQDKSHSPNDSENSDGNFYKHPSHNQNYDLNDPTYFNHFNDFFNRKKTIFNAVDEKQKFLEAVKNPPQPKLVHKNSNNQNMLNYFNFKFNNLDGEMVKLNFNDEVVYPKYSKKEILFKNIKEDIIKYQEQSQAEPETATALVPIKKNELSDDEDFIKSSIDLELQKERSSRKFRPY